MAFICHQCPAPHFRRFSPCDESLVGDGVGACGIVFNERAAVRCGIDVKVNAAAASSDGTCSSGKDLSEECVLSVCRHVVAEQIAGSDTDVIGKAPQVVMVQGTIYDAEAAVAVANGVALKHDFVDAKSDGVALEDVVCAKRFDV